MPQSNIICPKCGREFPWQVPRDRCRFCRTEFTRGTCYVCREYSENIRHGKCYQCSLRIKRESVHRQVSTANAEYAEWTETLKAVKRPYKGLSEEQWIEACRYFGGCAMCGNDTIDARMLFIPGHRGGVYTNFNVIPACERCATAHINTVNSTGNPFSMLYSKYSREQKERLDKIKKYLSERML